MATLTFGSGLRTLVTHPALYGWNWSYAIERLAVAVSRQRPRGSSTTTPTWRHGRGFDFANAQIDGQTVPILLGSAGARLGPPILSGHRLEANGQVVLGAATLAQLHKRVGETVTVTYGSPKDFPVYVPPTHLLVVGTATLPAVGNSGDLHTSMGTGALLPTSIEPPAFRKALTSPDPNENGPDMIAVQLRKRSGPDLPAGRRSRASPTLPPRSWLPTRAKRGIPSWCCLSSNRQRSSTTARPARPP